MKSLFKYIIYSVVIVTIIVVSMSIFKNHPEAQFVFIFPGIFMIAFSQIMDDSVRKAAHRLRLSRGR
jgi:hypothetical protein